MGEDFSECKMIPGMNPKQMSKMMQKMGIKQEEIDAIEVIIKTPDKKHLIVHTFTGIFEYYPEIKQFQIVKPKFY